MFTTPFPWRGGNQFTLHVDGEHYFARMLDAINSAQRSVALEMYLSASGEVFTRFRDALIAATSRSVSVRVLLDGYGSSEVVLADREMLLANGVHLHIYNPIKLQQGLKNLLRNHRKSLIVDDNVAFTGGAGLTDEFMTDRGNERAWRDVMLEIRGPAVNDWQLLFDHTWNTLRQPLKSYRMIRINRSSDNNMPAKGRVVTSYGPQAHYVLQSLYKKIKAARERVWIVTPYFVPSWNLRHRLIAAARFGVDTRVLVPGAHTDHPTIRRASQRYYAQLLNAGVRIFEYQPRFIHTKVALCDNWATVGSTNFDRWNVRWNLDANQEVADINFATQLVTMLDADFAESIELRSCDWQRRPWHQRLLEWFSGLLERWSGWLK